MTIPQAVLLSIIEGITEFLPVSSTGHLILASQLLGVPQTEFVKSFELFIQLGAIAAVAILYVKQLFIDKAMLINVFAAFLPTAIIGFIAYPLIKSLLLGNATIVVVSLLVGGIALILLESRILKKQSSASFSSRRAFMIGLIQALSFIPGVSRAAATIVGGMLVGLPRTAAVEFSFLLAIPTMLAATGYDLLKTSSGFNGGQWILLFAGGLVAFVSALLAVKAFIAFVPRYGFRHFGYYRIALGVLFLVYSTMTGFSL